MDFVLIKRLTASKRRAPRKRRSGRDARGAYLVEILVAMVCGTIVTLALVDMMSQNIRQSSTQQNDLYAQSVIAELRGFTETVRYAFLERNIGQHNLNVNRLTASSMSLRKQPLQIDAIEKQWQEMSQSSAFNGSVIYDITAVGPSTLRVTINLSWLDQGGFERTRRSVVIVSKKGSRAWSS